MQFYFFVKIKAYCGERSFAASSPYSTISRLALHLEDLGNEVISISICDRFIYEFHREKGLWYEVID